MWLRHVLDAEADSRHCKRVTVGFDQLLDDWRAVLARIGERLEVSWPNLSSATDLGIDEFLTPELRHHADQRAKVESATQGIRWISESYEILKRWSRDDERPSDRDSLDSIRSNLNDLGPVFGRPLLVGRTARQNERALGRKVDQLTTDLETESNRAQGLEDSISELSAHLETLDQTIAQQAGEAEKRSAEIQALNQDISRQTGEIEHRDAEIEALNEVVARQTAEAAERDAEIEGLTDSLSEAHAEREHQVDSLMRAVNERDSRIAALLQSSSWRITAPLRNGRLAIGWLHRKLVRLAQILGWLLTGRFRKAAQAMLPFYRRHAPRWIGSLSPVAYATG